MTNLANIPLAAKVVAAGIGALALLGGGVAVGTHLGDGGTPTSSVAPVVASPVPAPSQSPAKNAAAQVARRAAVAAEVQVLGVTAKELNADVKAGKTVQQLATAKGLTQAQFQTQYDAALQTQLDQAVTAGTLTQAQEQQAMKRLTTAIPNWSQVPQAKKSPSPTPTP
jgi:hypothetical protein